MTLRPQTNPQRKVNTAESAQGIGSFVKAGVVVALIVFGLLSGSYSLLVPPFESSDEPCHLDYAQFLLTQGRIPGIKGSTETCAGHQAPLYYLFLSLIVKLVNGKPLDFTVEAFSVERSSKQIKAFSYKTLSDMAADLHNLVALHRRGQDVYLHLKLTDDQHHRAAVSETDYFVWGARPELFKPRWIFLHDADDFFPFSRAVRIFHLVRLAQLIFGVFTVYLIYRVALVVFPEDPRMAWLSASVASAIPQFTFISGMLNNDNLVILLSSLSIYLIAKMCMGACKPLVKFSVLLGAIVGLAFLAKYTALFLLPLSLAALLLSLRSLASALKHATIFTVSFLAITGWLLLRNVALYGGVFGAVPVAEPAIARIRADVSLEAILSVLGEFFRWTFISFWGGFGWVSVPIGRLFVLLYLLLSLTAIWGFARYAIAAINKDRASARTLLILALSIVLVALSLLGHAIFYSWQPQGRHLFPSLAAIGLIFAIGWREACSLLVRKLGLQKPDGWQLTVVLVLLLIVVNLLCMWFYVFPKQPLKWF